MLWNGVINFNLSAINYKHKLLICTLTCHVNAGVPVSRSVCYKITIFVPLIGASYQPLLTRQQSSGSQAMYMNGCEGTQVCFHVLIMCCE